jgi:DHA2 family multidrug resistance protein
VVGTLIGRGVDARWMIGGGLLIMAAGNYWMALKNLYISPDQVIWPRVVLIVGLSMLFVSINVAAFKYIPPHLRGAAVGLFALLRNEGGSVGTSLSQAFQWRRQNFHEARVGEFLDPLNPFVNSFLEQGQAFFFQQTGDPAASQQMALQALENLREQQSSSLAYFDDFWLFGVLALGLVPLVLLMKRSVAEKGERIGAE